MILTHSDSEDKDRTGEVFPLVMLEYSQAEFMKLLPRHIFIFVLFTAILVATLRPVGDPDFWWHLQTGKWIVDASTIPYSDPFSYTTGGKEWITHEWLTEVIMYLFYSKAGIVTLIVFFSLIITCAYVFAYLRTSAAARPYVAGFVLILSAVTSAPLWGVRPQMISLLMASIFLFLLDQYERDRDLKVLIPIPLLMILWVNMHGGFILGIGIIGIYVLGSILHILMNERNGLKRLETWKPALSLAALVIICLITALINPNHYKLLLYPFQTIFDPAMQEYILEWASPNFHDKIWLPFGIMILALIGAGLAGKKPVSITRILLVIIFSFMAFRSIRHIPLFAIVTAPILADQLGQLIIIPSSKEIGKKIITWVNLILLFAGVCIIGIWIGQLPKKQQAKEMEIYPQEAAAWLLENHPEGNLFNSYSWGGYLIWKLYPDYLVYIDGRADIYGPEFMNQYATIALTQEGWESELQKTNARTVLVERESLLAQALVRSTEWTIQYQDDLSIIFYK